MFIDSLKKDIVDHCVFPAHRIMVYAPKGQMLLDALRPHYPKSKFFFLHERALPSWRQRWFQKNISHLFAPWVHSTSSTCCADLAVVCLPKLLPGVRVMQLWNGVVYHLSKNASLLLVLIHATRSYIHAYHHAYLIGALLDALPICYDLNQLVYQLKYSGLQHITISRNRIYSEGSFSSICKRSVGLQFPFLSTILSQVILNINLLYVHARRVL